MGKFRPIDTFRHELTSALVEQLQEARSTVEHEVIKAVVRRVTDGWTATVHHSDSPEDPDVMGYNLGLCLPWRRESDEEAAARKARWEAMVWDSEAGPPPLGVSMLQLLRQDTWWQTRDAPHWEGGKLVPVRIEDMDHNHRLNLLEWLRTRSEQLHSQQAGELLGAPDEVWASYEAEDPYEWIEEQELVQALERWTTPYAESPLTWRPMSEAPKDGTVFRVVDSDDDLHLVRWNDHAGEWVVIDDYNLSFPLHRLPRGWRELRDDERCPHGVPLINDRHIDYCLWCDHGHAPGEYDDCDKCIEDLERMDY